MSPTMIRPRKIVSGGQTGVDRAALDAALAAGVPCGGWVPKGRRAEDGRLDPKYPMTEADSADYAVRTELNVLHSDATLVVGRGKPTGGTRLTLALCRKHRKPVHLADAADPKAAAAFGRAAGYFSRVTRRPPS